LAKVIKFDVKATALPNPWLRFLLLFLFQVLESGSFFRETVAMSTGAALLQADLQSVAFSLRPSVIP